MLKEPVHCSTTHSKATESDGQCCLSPGLDIQGKRSVGDFTHDGA